MAAVRLPRTLFKYRAFSTNTLRMLSEAELYFAKPSTFNDPFDCNPTVRSDVAPREVERLWKHLASTRMTKAKAAADLGNHRYFATEYGGRFDDGGQGTGIYVARLCCDIETYVKEGFGKRGVLSLAAKWDCPLMWSHYADEHKGICIGYSTEDHRCDVLKPVNYDSTRYLKVSDLINWFIGDSADAEQTVFDQYFFAKAREWKYEKEWRAVTDTSGADDRPFRLSSVHFGLRCDPAVITTVVKLLAGQHDIAFHRMDSRDNGFKLGRYELDPAEIEVFGVSESVHFAFDEFEFDSREATGKISGSVPKK